MRSLLVLIARGTSDLGEGVDDEGEASLADLEDALGLAPGGASRSSSSSTPPRARTRAATRPWSWPASPPAPATTSALGGPDPLLVAFWEAELFPAVRAAPMWREERASPAAVRTTNPLLSLLVEERFQHLDAVRFVERSHERYSGRSSDELARTTSEDATIVFATWSAPPRCRAASHPKT